MPPRTSNGSDETRKRNEPKNDIITIRYIPLPPEKRAAWERSMRILTGIILEILKEEKPASALVEPADMATGRTKS